MRFNAKAYDQVFPRQQIKTPTVDEVNEQEDRMVEPVPDPPVIDAPVKVIEEKENGNPGINEPSAE